MYGLAIAPLSAAVERKKGVRERCIIWYIIVKAQSQDEDNWVLSSLHLLAATIVFNVRCQPIADEAEKCLKVCIRPNQCKVQVTFTSSTFTFILIAYWASSANDSSRTERTENTIGLCTYTSRRDKRLTAPLSPLFALLWDIASKNELTCKLTNK